MEIDFININHKKTNRNYLERVSKINKAQAAIKAKKWDYDYWDGSRDINYADYYYDGRWELIAKKMINYYYLNNNSKILNVGGGKGFLLYEFKKILPEMELAGISISDCAIRNSKTEVKSFLRIEKATKFYKEKRIVF